MLDLAGVRVLARAGLLAPVRLLARNGRGLVEVATEDGAYGARLVAHVVPAAGAQVDAGRLQGLVRESLARHAVPREVRVVDALPKGATGKVLHRELRARETA